MNILHGDAFNLLEKNHYQAHLILTDLPYLISKNTGFASVVNGVKRFAVSMDFGEWDKESFDIYNLCKLFYKNLRDCGTCIAFYDIWKMQELKSAMEQAGFKTIRLIIWEKTNPVPLNSQINYLTNSREVAILGVKGSNSTFHSLYDNGIYAFPIEHTADRIHPTQKPLKLFESLILKHSNQGDLVLDPFMGSGTTAVACINTGREFVGIEKDETYFKCSKNRIKNITPPLFVCE